MSFMFVFLFFMLVIDVLAICQDEHCKASIRHWWHKILCGFGKHDFKPVRTYRVRRTTYQCEVCRYCGIARNVTKDCAHDEEE